MTFDSTPPPPPCTEDNFYAVDLIVVSLFLLCVFTHVASIYANLLEQKKAFT